MIAAGATRLGASASLAILRRLGRAPVPANMSGSTGTNAAGYESAERVRDAEGRQYHIGLAPGEVARYIMLVGDPARATRVAGLFDRVELERRNREFVTYTGAPAACGSP
jgi:hypothetical protein